MTPSQFAALPESDQAWMLGYDVYRLRRLQAWREELADPEPKKNRYSPEVATLMMLTEV